MLLLFAPVLYHHVVLCIKVGGGKFEFITTSEQRGRAICSQEDILNSSEVQAEIMICEQSVWLDKLDWLCSVLWEKHI